MMDDESEVDGSGTPLDEIAEDLEIDVDVEISVEHSGDAFWYPTVEEVIEIHDAIIAEDPDGEPGTRDEERIQYAIDYIRYGAYGEKPESVHEKAFHLMRLLASNHWFVDGNKRTALNTTNLFYLFNGYDLDYGEDLRAMLKLLAVREDLIDREVGTRYLADQADELDLATLLIIALGGLADELGVMDSRGGS